MRTRNRLVVTILAIVLIPVSAIAQTAEICGNGIDDNGNDLTDEGCYPTLTTGVCESPLSCGDTGMVGWTTGSLHYDLPPDVAPNVPYGPGIGFRRFYMSQIQVGANPPSVNKTPFGTGWGHTYLTYLYDPGSHGNIVVHTSQGRDVLYKYDHTTGNYDYYVPQAGDHVMNFRVYTAGAAPDYYLQLLTGETLHYNSSGQIVEIWDNLALANKVAITWDATTNGNVSTVTDASGERRLSFTYTNGLMTSLAYQLNFGTSSTASWTTELTITYDYTNGVTRDATSQWFVPQNSTEWTALLAGTGIPNPTNLWLLQEASGNLADSIGSSTLTQGNWGGGQSYQQTVSGWSRYAIKISDGVSSNWYNTSYCNPASTQCTALVIGAVTTTPGAGVTRNVFALGDVNGALAGANRGCTVACYPQTFESWDGTAASNFRVNWSVHPWVLSADPSNHFTFLQADGASSTPTWATGTSAQTQILLGSIGSIGAAGAAFLFAAGWNGSALTSAQATTLISRIKNGAGLSQVTIGSQLAQKYVHDSNGYLKQVLDGAGKQVAAFAYSSTTAGQIDLITTSRGTVGFDYAPSRTGCSTSGMTLLYFNRGNSTSCSTDSDCGTGYMCGGKTGTGSTGTCFLAARCLTTSTANATTPETVITNVSPIGPGGGSCSGACTDVMQYSWSSSSGLLNVIGREDPLTNFTAATYNSNGLPTQIWYGATDNTGTGANRTVYISYDSTYPGRVSTVMRQSDINTVTCNGVAANCVTTTYNYSATDCHTAANNQLSSTTQAGWTLNSSGSTVSYSDATSYSYDCFGRVTEIDGAISGIKTTYDYYAAYSNGGYGSANDNFVKDYKAYYSSTGYLQPNVSSYDFWGHPTAVQAPDGNYTCDAYDANRGYLTSRTKAMNGQTDCAHGSSLDITSSWTRDSWLRLTRMTRPDSSCVDYTYNANGQTSTATRRDPNQCANGGAGDYQTWTYTADGLVSEVDTYDQNNNLTAKQPYTYFAGRQLQDVVNPCAARHRYVVS